MSSSELIEIALRDNSFYKSSGGGITLSGGEPLVQPGFCIDILKKAKHHNLHTCLDTSGFVAENTLKESLDYTDIYLYDIKETDDIFHVKYTGQSNKLILSNLKMLNANNAEIILRCPIIPGLNDREDHFRKIAELSLSINNLKGINILPYHTMGNNKAGQLGMKSGIFTVPGPEEKILWEELLISFGILNAEVK
jgi:pyruvate formate lyase activating enzyme